MPKYKNVDHDGKLKVIDLNNHGYKPYAIRRRKQYNRRRHFVVTKPRFCQLIMEQNKETRVAFCKAFINSDVHFEDVFTDESSIHSYYNKVIAYGIRTPCQTPTEGQFVGTYSSACQWHYQIRIIYQRDLEEHPQAIPGARLSRWLPFTTG